VLQSNHSAGANPPCQQPAAKADLPRKTQLSGGEMRALTLNRCRRIAAAGVAALAAWLSGATIAHADVTVTINYDMVETRVSPRQEVIRSHRTESYKISSDQQIDASGSTGTNSRAKLGGTITGNDEGGKPSTFAYRIVNGAFVFTTHNVGYFHVLKITTDGRATCSATKTFFRNPGQQYIEAETLDGKEHIMASKFTAENMTCSIRE
jgi:hypothetical protein